MMVIFADRRSRLWEGQRENELRVPALPLSRGRAAERGHEVQLRRGRGGSTLAAGQAEAEHHVPKKEAPRVERLWQSWWEAKRDQKWMIMPPVTLSMAWELTTPVAAPVVTMVAFAMAPSVSKLSR